ncbi:putative membrane protein YkgB [Chitinophaga dinghuensis]|uniref:Putative membrane protein YkgB n=1 Tax=Chitinophaga dinghuensis TaxID=1539050 RepID=A0A327VNT0_9BACT|nr:DUF417 family protein [Chitinophaga dinghuensis]RAJ76753.1 putative membrane protein YkgB [Chitinophaga dinghuensis]
MLKLLANVQEYFIHFLRISIFVILAWIGALKVCHYEADGIVPFVANSPLMSFFYHHPAPEYKQYMNPEGKEVKKNQEWHVSNGTYPFAYGLGAVIVLIGILILSGIWYPKPGLVGGLLTAGMALITLSFFITTPEVYVPDLGGDGPTPHHGFPYLAGPGRMVLKDLIMMAGGLVAASDCARRLLKRS